MGSHWRQWLRHSLVYIVLDLGGGLQKGVPRCKGTADVMSRVHGDGNTGCVVGRASCVCFL